MATGNRGGHWPRDERSDVELAKDEAVKRDPDIRGATKGRREAERERDK